nr:MAG: hypothetical protein 1 [Weivirus-like virus sp.]
MSNTTNTSEFSGSRSAKRSQREEMLIFKYKLKLKAARKLIPKKLRSQEVRKAKRDAALYKACYLDEEEGFVEATEGPELQSGLFSFARKVLSLPDKIEQAADSVTDLTSLFNSKINEIVSMLKSSVNGMLWQVPLLCLAYCIADRLNISMLLLGAASPLLVKHLGAFWTNTFGMPTLHGAEDILSLITTLLVSSVLPNTNNLSSLAETILRRVGNFSKAQDGFKAMYVSLIEFAEKAINAIADWFGASHVEFSDPVKKVLNEWVHAFNDFEIACAKGNTPNDVLRKAVQLQVDGFGLRQHLRTPQLASAFNRHLERLGVLLQSRQGALSAANSFRQQPVFCLLGGHSGVGKTVLQRYIAVAALIKAGYITAEMGIEQLWQKGLTEYWNGYVGQLCLILDDVFQVKTPDSSEASDFMLVIRAIGSWAFPLNYADLESKGRFYFSSPLLMGSTNVENVKSAAANFIACPEAVSRRIGHGHWIHVMSDYLNPDGKTFNYTKWIAEFKQNLLASKASGEVNFEDCFPNDAWKLHPHDFESGPEDSPNPITVRDLVNNIADDLIKNRKRHDEEVELSKLYFDGLQPTERPLKPLCEMTMSEVQASVAEDVGLVPIIEHQSGEEEIEVYEDSISDHDWVQETMTLVSEFAYREQIDAVPSPERLTEARLEYLSELEPIAVRRAVSDTTLTSYEPTPGVEIRALYPNLTAPSVCSSKDTIRSRDHDTLLSSSKRKVSAWLEHLEIERTKYKSWYAGFCEWVLGWFDYVKPYADAAMKTAFHTVGQAIGVTLDVGQAAFKVAKRSKLLPDMSHLRAASLALAIVSILKMVVGLACRCAKAVGVFFYDCGSAFLDMVSGAVIPNHQSHNPSGGVPQKPKINLLHQPVHQNGATATDYSMSKVLANCYHMSYVLNGAARQIGTIQFFEGELAAMPYHFWRDINNLSDATGVISLVSVQSKTCIHDIPLKEFLKFKTLSYRASGIDLIFLRFDRRSIKAMKNITGLLLTQKQVTEFMGHNSDVHMHAVKLDPSVLPTAGLRIHTQVSRRCVFRPTVTVEGHEYVQSVEYDASMVKGDCGSPLLMGDARYYGGRCYIGMHFAGTRSFIANKGYASVITFEMVQNASKTLGTYKDRFEQDLAEQGYPVEECTVEEQSALIGEGKLVSGSFQLLGKVTHPVNSANKSKLRLSAMGVDEVFGPNPKAPSLLTPVMRDGVLIQPMLKALEPYKTPHEWREVPMLELAGQQAFKKFMEETDGRPRPILTPEESAGGIPEMGLKGLARDTSAGYPHRLEATSGKKLWLGDGETYDFDSDKWKEMKAHALRIADDARKNIRSAVVFVACLKDEPLKLEKVRIGKTRLFSASACSYSIAFKMFFGAFLGWHLKLNVNVGVGPGMNPLTQWSDLVNFLKEVGNNHFAGDYKGFDASQQPYLHQVILDFINYWYRQSPDWKEEDEIARNILWLDLIHSRQLIGLGRVSQYIVQWNKSLPSGHPMTTIVNTLFVQLTMSTCYMTITGDVNDMHKHIRVAPFGDDNMNGVSDARAEVFNQVTVAEKMLELFGLVYTDDVKDGALQPFKPLEECTFLQRGFYKDLTYPGGWAPKLGEGSFLYAPYWYRSNKATVDDMMANVRTALGEMSIHPPEVWDKYTGILFPWLREHNLTPKLPFYTREAARTWRLTHVDTWV